MSNSMPASLKSKNSEKSSKYPYLGLEESVQVISKLRALGRNVTDVSLASLLSSDGKANTNSGSYIRKKASLGYYGLLTGRGKDLYITDLAQKILFPPAPEDKINLLQDAFKNVTLFKKYYDKLEKNTPVSLMLIQSDLINVDRIQPKAVKEFLKTFVESGRFVNLIDYVSPNDTSQIILKSNTLDILTAENVEETKSIDLVISNDSESILHSNSNIGNNLEDIQLAEVTLSSGKAKLYLPKKLTTNDLKKLKLVIDAYAIDVDQEE